MTPLSWLLGESILVTEHMTCKISQRPRGGIFGYHVRRQTELPWQVVLSPAAVGWSGSWRSRVCCRSETALRPQWAGGRSRAGGRSSVVTKVVGLALAWSGKTRCWSCCPGGRSQSRRDDWRCTIVTTNTPRASQHHWVLVSPLQLQCF